MSEQKNKSALGIQPNASEFAAGLEQIEEQLDRILSKGARIASLFGKEQPSDEQEVVDSMYALAYGMKAHTASMNAKYETADQEKLKGFLASTNVKLDMMIELLYQQIAIQVRNTFKNDAEANSLLDHLCIKMKKLNA